MNIMILFISDPGVTDINFTRSFALIDMHRTRNNDPDIIITRF